jgi:hypothetical protein
LIDSILAAPGAFVGWCFLVAGTFIMNPLEAEFYGFSEPLVSGLA